MTSKKLTKSKDDVWLDGVCGGLGQHFGIDPFVIRMIFLFCNLFWLYFILMLLMPDYYDYNDK